MMAVCGIKFEMRIVDVLKEVCMMIVHLSNITHFQRDKTIVLGVIDVQIEEVAVDIRRVLETCYFSRHGKTIHGHSATRTLDKRVIKASRII